MKFTFFEYFSARRFFPGLPTDPILHAWMVNTQTLDDDDDDEFDDELDDCSIHRYTQLHQELNKKMQKYDNNRSPRFS